MESDSSFSEARFSSDNSMRVLGTLAEISASSSIVGLDYRSCQEASNDHPLSCSTPFREQRHRHDNGLSHYLNPYLETNGQETPQNKTSPKITSLPKPSFASAPVKRRARVLPWFTQYSDDCCKKLEGSVNLELSHDSLKRKTQWNIGSKTTYSFKILDPMEVMKRSSVEAVKGLVGNQLDNNILQSLDESLVVPKSWPTEPENLGLLGNGDSGKAFKSQKFDGAYIAVKRYNRMVQSNKDLARLIKEAAALSVLNHVNIVSYMECYVIQNHFFVEMEYCNWLPLRSIINKYNSLSLLPFEAKIKSFLIQLLGALAYMHDRGIVHYDIKPDNIFTHNPTLVDSSPLGDSIEHFDSSDLFFKLGDFGHCFISGVANFDVSEGDSRYLAKEALELVCDDYGSNSRYPNKPSWQLDIFALGVTTAEYSGYADIPTCGDQWQKIRLAGFDNLFDNYSLELLTFLNNMIHINPDFRPTAIQCLSHCFLIH